MLYSFELGIHMNVVVGTGQTDDTEGSRWQSVDILFENHYRHTGHLGVLLIYLHCNFFFQLHLSAVKLKQI